MIAAVTDNSLRVWEARRGAAQHTLVGHTAHAFILEGHPFDGRMLMSAAYDGRIMLWDVVAGAQLARCALVLSHCRAGCCCSLDRSAAAQCSRSQLRSSTPCPAVTAAVAAAADPADIVIVQQVTCPSDSQAAESYASASDI